MQLRRLRLVNFRQHAQTDLVIGPGLTAIIGPNGSGKTTLLEAIAWAFYGNPAARGSRESIRWNRAPARSSVRVEVEFALGAHEFKVTRGLYSAALYQDQFDTPIVNSHQEVTARVQRLLGMTRQEFFNTYFTGQKELAVMASMGSTERAAFLSRVLGYEKLRKAQDRARERRAELRGELAGLERGLADMVELTGERDAARARLADAGAASQQATERRESAARVVRKEGPAWTRAVELRESAIRLDSDRRVAERDVAEARREFERLDRDLADALTARSKLDEMRDELARVGPLKEELAMLDAEAQSAGRRRTLTGQLRELNEHAGRERERVERLGDVRATLETARARLGRLREELKAAENSEGQARTAWVRDRQDAETKHGSLREQYMDLKKQRESVVQAGPDGSCPFCKRSLGAVYGEMLATLERQLEEIEVRGKFFRSRMEQLAGEPDDVKEAGSRVEAAMRGVEDCAQEVARCEDRIRERRDHERELERTADRRRELEREIASLPDRYDSERHDSVRAKLRDLEPVIELAASLDAKATSAEAMVAEAETAERMLSEREARLKALEGAIKDVGFSEEAYEATRRRHDEAMAALRDAELAEASLEAEVKAAAASVEVAEERIREREARAARIQAIRAEHRLHDELDRALTDLRSELNAQMRPELSARASDFLATLTNGRYSELELDEKYEILIIEDGQAKQVISGGEEDIANLVLRLAISEMVAERAGQPLSLLVLDEIFGSLDEFRRHGVVELLRGLADRFPQVILITHIESVREGVDRVLRVELNQKTGAAVVIEDEWADVAA